MKDVFITATFRNEWNRSFNVKLCAALEQRGLTVFLPQRDSSQSNDRNKTFVDDVAGLRSAASVVAIGTRTQTSNWGFEIGVAFAMNKPVIILTDKDHLPDLMPSGAMSKLIVPGDIDQIDSYIEELVSEIRRYLGR